MTNLIEWSAQPGKHKTGAICTFFIIAELFAKATFRVYKYGSKGDEKIMHANWDVTYPKSLLIIVLRKSSLPVLSLRFKGALKRNTGFDVDFKHDLNKILMIMGAWGVKRLSIKNYDTPSKYSKNNLGMH